MKANKENPSKGLETLLGMLSSIMSDDITLIIITITITLI